MLITVNCHNAHLYEDELQQMFALRHRVLVQQEGWTELVSDDGLERDAFDDDYTTYLISVTPKDGKVAGCVRFTPSIRPSLSSEVFPQLFDLKDLPTGPDTYDGSRILVDPDAQNHGRPTQTTSELYCGMFEFGLALELKAITCIVAMKWLEYMRHWQWEVSPLGLPQKFGEESVIGLALHPTAEMLANIRKIRKQILPVLSSSDLCLIKANHRIVHGLGSTDQEVA